jgi:peroxiredoxin-like protein
MAEAAVFHYETEVEWKGDKALSLRGAKLPEIQAGAPPEFRGREDHWSPEHLFIAALNSCYMLTFLTISENSKIPLVSFSSTAKGKLEKVPGSGFQITEIVLKPKVVITSAKDLERLPRMLEKAKENCFISNSIKSAIKIEPAIFHHQTQFFPSPLGEAPASGNAPEEPQRSSRQA